MQDPPITPRDAATAERSGPATGPIFTTACTYVLKLRHDVGTDALVGRLEHVLSGRRHDFDHAAALVSCLRHEQALQHAGDDAAPAGADRPPALQPPPG